MLHDPRSQPWNADLNFPVVCARVAITLASVITSPLKAWKIGSDLSGSIEFGIVTVLNDAKYGNHGRQS
ncbi:hypothetical protein RIF29_25513 [Crotalaria pallida]|uniref:Uncharacterized protein n=1 Tax=Crotalaria pallida TaxID=3830 RepID=A0AAN9HXJ9_CROPI